MRIRSFGVLCVLATAILGFTAFPAAAGTSPQAEHQSEETAALQQEYKVRVTVDNAPVRTGAYSFYPVYTRFSAGTKIWNVTVHVNQYNNTWYHINGSGKFIYSGNVTRF